MADSRTTIPKLKPGHPRRVVVLGCTGSIGTSTLDVIQAMPGRFPVEALVAHKQWELLAQQCHQVHPRYAILTDTRTFERVDHSRFPKETEILPAESVPEIVAGPDVDIVVAAVVGAAGLTGTWAALEAGKTVALANKETLVVGGQLVTDLAAKHGAMLLPVDSEHSAIFQAMTGHSASDVERVILTASGGPFRGKTAADLGQVTPQQALKHPTWQMGKKITIDSATLMNKALEIIEARWLFGLKREQIDVILHPESMVHSFVEFHDGSVLAQLSPPDMRLPIQLALTYPERLPGPARRVDWRNLTHLRFETPDHESFPALSLGFEVAERGGTCGAVLNAANEVAVQRFLDRDLAFLDIARCCRAVLNSHNFEPAPSLDQLMAMDRWARQEALRWNRQ